MIPTAHRVEAHTPQAIKRRFDERAKQDIAQYLDAGSARIDQRLHELDTEWNVERVIETEAPLTIGLGIGLGLALNRRWFALSAVAAGMVVLHSLQGWYPLLPALRRLGLRSQSEIEHERNALRVLRGDHEAYQGAHPVPSIH